MAAEDDLKIIARQEKELVFDRFDEERAFALGSLTRDIALRQGLSVVIDIRLFNRPLFYAAIAGTSGSNPEWARRKTNVVRRFLKSTYRMVLEMKPADRTFAPQHGLSAEDYILAGGGFPITVAGAGVIGVMAISGLPERADHALAVEALCAHLGKNHAAYKLPSE